MYMILRVYMTLEKAMTEIEIKITSDSDLILINNIITSVNSELPDATISFEDIEFICNNTVNLNYTVFNVNSTGSLPAGTPIKFYLEGNQIGQTVTNTTLPINGEESGIIPLTIPTGTVADPFTVIAVVDDGGGGVSTVDETDEANNEYQQIITIYTPVPLFQVCDVTEITGPNDGLESFDLDSKNTEIATFGGVFNPDLTVTYHLIRQMPKQEPFLL